MAEFNNTLEFTADFGVIQKVEDTVPVYGGDYEVTPLVTTQILPTAQKKMRDDVTVWMIQTEETPNAAGGVTFEILG